MGGKQMNSDEQAIRLAVLLQRLSAKLNDQTEGKDLLAQLAEAIWLALEQPEVPQPSVEPSARRETVQAERPAGQALHL